MTKSTPGKPGFLMPKKYNVKVDIKTIQLGEAGITYIQSQLDKAGPLSRVVLQLFGNRGTCLASLPVGTKLERAKQFDTGGLMSMDDYYPWFSNYITSYWGNKCRLLFEDPWMKLEDFKKLPPKGSYFTADSVMYYTPRKPDYISMLEAGVLEVRSFLLIGFVIASSIKPPESGKTADAIYVQKLAENTQAVFVSAYDQEGILIWTK
jgi:hypothetical protein